MIVIGEKINSSIPGSKEAIGAKDARQILALAQDQARAGADYIDINAGTFLEREAELLVFLGQTIQAGAPELRLSVDTPDYRAAEAALKALSGRGHLINSVTLERERLENMTALALEHGCGVIALCMPEEGTAEDPESRLAAADKLVNFLAAKGIENERIFLDPLLRPLGADDRSGADSLETVRRLRELFPGCHISCGLSNLSFGLPRRRLLNRAFAVAAIAAGLDAAIADPLDRELMGLIAAGEAVTGRDEYCLDYIGKCRGGLI